MSQVEESDAGVRVCWDQEGETLILTHFYVFHHGGYFFLQREKVFFSKGEYFFTKGESIFPTEWLRDRRWKTEPETSTAR